MEKLAGLRHLFVTVLLGGFSGFIVIPAITDVTMSALCPGKDECSLAIYLTGFQQAIIGLGTVVMTPVIGNLSDAYGRKALLTIPMALSIIPLAILAYSRTTTYFYAYYVIRTLTAMIGEGSINCLALAYVADNISEGQRASAFGVLSGVASAAFVCGTLAARFLSTASTFQVATLVSMIATVYMRVFLKETSPNGNSSQPLLKKEPGMSPDDSNSSEKIQTFKKIPSVGDLISLLKSRVAFSQAAVVVFFSSLADGGIQASLLYFLKARFHFNKDQFADIMLIVGVTGTISQLLFMPLLAPRVSEEKLLSIGLFMACTNIFLNSIAWSFWVIHFNTFSYCITKLLLPFKKYDDIHIFKLHCRSHMPLLRWLLLQYLRPLV
ncbi:hypothetical protein PVL29_002867 [Vitis rotundifolia]|uniref:Major facilitator superfamily (MFS) profile domain-containing protein n=1 Tax=Vitis rotundifolia TaxID=103349 RepID=A0AA39ABD6_VITRO|nr:hypothetical protein PVL29_002867 [Vitis rotundifolia]